MSDAGRLFRRIVGFVVHGGSWRLRIYEQQILDALAKSLTGSDAAALASQMARLDHVKRLHADRMVTFYFEGKESLPRLSLQEPAYCAARFRLGRGESATTAAVFTHLGLLSSIEFTKSPRAIGASGRVDIRPVSARSGRSVADEIDKEEHG